MGERAILFSAPMLRALLDGRKTQTRRILNLPTKTEGGFPIYERPDMGGWEPTTVGGSGCNLRDGTPAPEKIAIWHQTTGICMSTPIQPGDRLWVRESLRATSNDQGIRWLSYAADGKDVCPTTQWTKERNIVPSIHMPRWASRLTLTVTGVRVQRLQEISEEDAKAEGMDDTTAQAVLSAEERHMLAYAHIATPHALSRVIFETVWEQINGPESWPANPWVAAYTFTVERRNIDEGLGQRADATPKNPLSEGRERS